jgi:uncharacterized membrane protein
MLVSALLKPNFEVDTFGYAFAGAAIISIVSVALNVLTGNTQARISVRRPPPPKKDDDDKPVIDV